MGNHGHDGPRARVLRRLKRAVAGGAVVGGVALPNFGCDLAPVPITCRGHSPDEFLEATGAWVTPDAGPAFVQLVLSTYAEDETFPGTAQAVGATVTAVRQVSSVSTTGQTVLQVDLAPGPGVRFIDVEVAAQCAGEAGTLRWRLDVSGGVGSSVGVTRR